MNKLEHATRTTPPEDELLGQLIAGKYRVSQMLAHGGMGRVYKGIQEPLGRPVAIKVMAPLAAREDRAAVYQGRFFREASICSRLSHPNTVIIHDYGVLEDGTYYLVMEYLEGRTLRQAIQQDGPFDVQRMIHVARQIGGSLMDAHQAGVIHRDLKPPNILMVPRGGDPDFVKVVDFGLVKALDTPDSSDELTGEGVFVGSPVYMAPEQFFDRQTDQRSEIYALGVIMYEMLVGQPPFPRVGSTTTQDVIVQHMSKPVPRLSEVCQHYVVPPQIEALVMRCLAKRPDERPQSMEEIHEILHNFEISILSGRMGAMTREESASFSTRGMYFNGAGMEGSGEFGPDPTPPHAPHITADRSMPRGMMVPPPGYDRPSREWPSREMSAEMMQASSSKAGLWLLVGVGLGVLILAVGLGAWWVGQSGGAQQGSQPASAPLASAGEVSPMVRLRFESSPSGATVQLGERILGETPMDLQLPMETFASGEAARFVLSKEGYRDRTLTVTPMAGGEHRLEATLESSEAPPAEDKVEPAVEEPQGKSRRGSVTPRRGGRPAGDEKGGETGRPGGGGSPPMDIKMER